MVIKLVSPLRNTNVAHLEPQKGTSTMAEPIIEGQAKAEHKPEHMVNLVLLSKEDIKKDQDHIRKSLVKLDMNVHNNAVQCLMHADKHGDTSLMRRLVIEVVSKDTGYRQQGLIAWMRAFSPMELVGDVINLSGVDDKGNKRLFKIAEANETPFRDAPAFREAPIRAVYRDTLMSGINNSMKRYKAAKENTLMVDGKPTAIDQTKDFLDGIHLDKLDEFFGKIDSNVIELSQFGDNTAAVRKAQRDLAKSQAQQEAIEKVA